MPYKKPLSAEAKARQVAYQKEWYLANKQKVLARSKNKYESNKESILVSQKARYQEIRLGKLAKQRQKRKDNPEQTKQYDKEYRAANREKANKKERAYKTRNPERVRTWAHTRRSKTASGNLTNHRISSLKKLQNNICPCCKADIEHEYEIDHIQPLALGGTNTDDNIQLLCKSCNRKKGAKHPITFMQEMGYLL